jgi:uncharacterized protein (TIGR03118 family)
VTTALLSPSSLHLVGTRNAPHHDLVGQEIRETRRKLMFHSSRFLKACAAISLTLASSAALAQYKVTNRSSNQVHQAHHDDPLLVNAWGLTYGPGSPFWVSDNGSGWSTLYDASGAAKSLKVEIASAGDNGPGSPTGIVFNGSPEFQVGGWAPFFIFATLDGTISGWAPQTDLHNTVIAVNNSKSKAVYTGLGVTSKASGNHLFAVNAGAGQVEMYDGAFAFLSTLTDPNLPTGLAPFNVQDINGQVYVTYAASNGGPGGVIDIFSEDGAFVKRLVEGAPLNQAWGLAIAPSNFGPLSNTLLVGNNTNHGTINAFNAVTGKFVGTVRGANNKAIQIDQLWGIAFGGGSASDGATNELFFAAGPSGNLAGTFGSITVQ